MNDIPKCDQKSGQKSPAQTPRGLVAHAGSTIQLNDGRDDDPEFRCETPPVFAAAFTWAVTEWATIASDGVISGFQLIHTKA